MDLGGSWLSQTGGQGPLRGPRGHGAVATPTRAQRENDFLCKTAESLRFAAGLRELPLLSSPAQAPGLWSHLETAWDQGRRPLCSSSFGNHVCGFVSTPQRPEFPPAGACLQRADGEEGGDGEKGGGASR